MRSNELPSVSVSRGAPSFIGRDPLRTVVSVRGEHDMATRAHLFVTIVQAARLTDDDIVVDLSGVSFMDASTIDALVLARNRLRARSRSLSIRAPSPPARRVLELCGLTQLIEEGSAPAQPPEAPALGSWVDVPARDRGADAGQPPADDEAPAQEPAGVTVPPREEAAGSARQPRAPL